MAAYYSVVLSIAVLYHFRVICIEKFRDLEIYSVFTRNTPSIFLHNS